MTPKLTPKFRKTLKITVMDRIRGYFLAGLVVTAPVAITIYLTYIFFAFIDEKVGSVLPLHEQGGIPGLGIIIAVSFFILVGWFTSNFFGRMFVRISEFVFGKMPVIRILYGAVKQIFETLTTNQSQAFRECVLVEYPRHGTWTLGFVTGVTKGAIQDMGNGEEVLNVFIPTSPAPTAGFLLFVPRSQAIKLDMTIEDGLKLIVSAGIITPPEKQILT